MANDNRAPRYKHKQTTTRQKAVEAAKAKARRQGRNTRVAGPSDSAFGGESWGGSAGTPPGKVPPSSRARVSGRYPPSASRNVAHG